MFKKSISLTSSGGITELLHGCWGRTTFLPYLNGQQPDQGFHSNGYSIVLSRWRIISELDSVADSGLRLGLEGVGPLSLGRHRHSFELGAAPSLLNVTNGDLGTFQEGI